MILPTWQRKGSSKKLFCKCNFRRYDPRVCIIECRMSIDIFIYTKKWSVYICEKIFNIMEMKFTGVCRKMWVKAKCMQKSLKHPFLWRFYEIFMHTIPKEFIKMQKTTSQSTSRHYPRPAKNTFTRRSCTVAWLRFTIKESLSKIK